MHNSTINMAKKYIPTTIKTIIKSIIKYIHYLLFAISFLKKRKALSDGRFSCSWKDRLPCLLDRTQTTNFEPHYIYHIAWAIREINKIAPGHHIDFSSSLYFIVALSASIRTTFYDYRPADIHISNLFCKKADLCNIPLPDNSVECLSCLHVLEHVGLERYGDPFAPQGDIQAINELKRILKQDGHLLVAVPMGEIPRIQYNAHRIYSYSLFLSYFRELKLEKFSFINDKKEFIEFATEEDTVGQAWGCGCFLFRK